MIDVKITKIRLDRKISKLQRRAKNTIPLMAEIAGDMMDAVEENFEKEGRPKWKKLAPSTLKARARKGLTGPILDPGNSAGLSSSINTRYTNNESAAGTNRHYGKYIQLGTKNMPARQFLKLTDGDVKQIKNRVGRFFSGKNG